MTSSGISLAAFTIAAFKEARFGYIRAQAGSFNTLHNLKSRGFKSGLLEG